MIYFEGTKTITIKILIQRTMATILFLIFVLWYFIAVPELNGYVVKRGVTIYVF